MEYTRNEYLLREFQNGGGVEERIFTLTTVIAINFVLFLVFLGMIKQSSLNHQEELQTPEWKFAYKIERPKAFV